MGVISAKLRESARGQPCCLQIPGVCNHNPETTVLTHIQSEWKGMGNKSPDFVACFACYDCHNELDNHRLSKEDELFYSLRGMQRTWKIWIEMGLIVIPVDPQTAKKRPKKKAKMASRPLKSRSSFGKSGFRRREEAMNE